MSGWIKIHRKFEKWGWNDKPEMVSLWLHLLLDANYEDKIWHGKPVKRGQVIFGLAAWSERTGISQQTLRTCLERLKSTCEITCESTNKFTIITIVKYDDYQLHENELTDTSTSKSTNDQQTTNKQLTTPKEIKNLRTKEIVSKKEDASLFGDSLEVIISEDEKLPESVPPELFAEFLKARLKNKRVTNSPLAVKILIRKLWKFKNEGHDLVKIIERAIIGGWSDLWAPKDDPSGAVTQTGRKTFQQMRDEENAKNLEEARKIYEQQNS